MTNFDELSGIYGNFKSSVIPFGKLKIRGIQNEKTNYRSYNGKCIGID